MAAFDPKCVVIGGGVSDAGDLLLEPTRESMLRSLVGRGYRAEPPVLLASLGPQAGFIGRRPLGRARPIIGAARQCVAVRGSAALPPGCDRRRGRQDWLRRGSVRRGLVAGPSRANGCVG